jgi:hypothetical protein
LEKSDSFARGDFTGRDLFLLELIRCWIVFENV